MTEKASTKNYDIAALENARKAQHFTYKELAKLARLPYQTVQNLLSPRRHKVVNRQFQYFRKPNNILRIAFALQLQEHEYLTTPTTSEK